MKNKKTMSRVLSYIGKYKLLLPISILMALISVALTLYVPVLIGDPRVEHGLRVNTAVRDRCVGRRQLEVRDAAVNAAEINQHHLGILYI